MAERFGPGDRVRVRLTDPVGHTRAPRYVRGHSGTVVQIDGSYPVPDAVVAGSDPEANVEPVYAVRFAAEELWGAGAHTVTINLWERYLEPAGSDDRPAG